MGSYFQDYINNKVKPGVAAVNQQPFTDAAAYRTALEKAAYGDAGAQYGQGLGQITNWLASAASPYADSGAGTALRMKLASQIYGGARSKVAGGYAQYLAQALAQLRQNQQQLAMAKYLKNANKKSFGDYLGGALGGAAGFALGGPVGAALGYGAGSGAMGGTQASDAYYG